MLTRREVVMSRAVPLAILGQGLLFILPRNTLYTAGATYFLFLFCMVGWWSFEVLRSRRKLIAADFRFCLHCQYPLQGLGDSGECPECGARFSIHTLRSKWKRAYRI